MSAFNTTERGTGYSATSPLPAFFYSPIVPGQIFVCFSKNGTCNHVSVQRSLSNAQKEMAFFCSRTPIEELGPKEKSAFSIATIIRIGRHQILSDGSHKFMAEGVARGCVSSMNYDVSPILCHFSVCKEIEQTASGSKILCGQVLELAKTYDWQLGLELEQMISDVERVSLENPHFVSDLLTCLTVIPESLAVELAEEINPVLRLNSLKHYYEEVKASGLGVIDYLNSKIK